MRSIWAVVFVSVVACAVASAQWRTPFENPPYVTVPGGQLLPGQDGWYTPVTLPSVDFQVFTYSDPNGLMPVPNPQGTLQYVAAMADDPNVSQARAHRDTTFPTAGKFVVWFDMAATYDFSGVTHDNYASFSVLDQSGDVGNRAYITLFSGWHYLLGDPNNPEDPNQMQCRYLDYNDAGVANAQPGISPGAAWEPLQLNTWYRLMTGFDFGTNKFLKAAIVDLLAGTGTEVDLTQDPNYATEWFMAGGAAGHTNWQTVRIFTGNSGTGGNNRAAYDNICIGPGVGTGDMNCDGVIDFGDINPFVMMLSNPADYLASYPNCCLQNGDVNLDGSVDFADINPFVGLLTGG